MPKYMTKQRRLLTDYLRQHIDENLSAGQIAQALSDTISKSAVYRNLSDMEAEGKLHRVAAGGSREVIYRYSGGVSCSQSLHLSCKKCGKTVHMQKQIADSLVDKVAQSDDFAIDKGETVIYGVCSGCQNKSSSLS
ncbi:Fur family transcriptional regulator [Ruminococcus sp.]|uniref:Fur family transcriptional regulator n=1 Tax=Ruminococcus sp. TaxID=41978 RepID=UPI002E802B98|nr:transcriptional repressor [Ruminococcus sp.]MEE3493094.1 transcriptional repressor [Ruminococcus sp.]